MYALLWRMGMGGTLANGLYAVGASSAASLLLLVPVPLLGRCIEVIIWKVTCISRVMFFGPTDLAVRSFSLCCGKDRAQLGSHLGSVVDFELWL